MPDLSPVLGVVSVFCYLFRPVRFPGLSGLLLLLGIALLGLLLLLILGLGVLLRVFFMEYTVFLIAVFCCFSLLFRDRLSSAIRWGSPQLLNKL
ncbi:hypothetical protein KSS87_016540 [Heliosperma pusillum]|nr:hypothetical protein KSS87_016540 [Heliosperma pusillum]